MEDVGSKPAYLSLVLAPVHLFESHLSFSVTLIGLYILVQPQNST